MLSTLPAFLAACLLIAASPGPSTILIIRNALRGRRAGMMTVLGNETGVFVWGLCAALGLTTLLQASRLAYDGMRIAGVAVLVGFGVHTLRQARRADGADLAGAAADAAPRPWRAYRSGLLLNLANPKAGVFAMAFLPQFVPPSVPAGVPHFAAMTALAGVWAVFETGYYAAYVWGVGRLRRVLERPGARRRLERISGCVLIALGVGLAVES
ncbi:LysE family translocator [Streptomyces sp. 7-21]|jgi:threonine/homoserine/homoserine lactone efflux protein|uniref:LysE family translocator n=1 Tax=Streptomyces sp. 7-21 TaxID=2802283 RepID=UPI00191DA4AD|nr:LysE family translocator [Streptomyces sp. 7-21]MBL1067036.1 LysE family translocator [Streptomyces sp. 7-21]